MKHRLSRFELMRRNRDRLKHARVAADAEACWAQHSAQLRQERDFQDTSDWLAETRQHARRASSPPEREPRFWRVLINLLFRRRRPC